MSSASNVAFIFDTDALTQILIANQQGLLQVLSNDLRPQLDKAVRNGWINILSARHRDQIALELEANGSRQKTKGNPD